MELRSLDEKKMIIEPESDILEENIDKTDNIQIPFWERFFIRDEFIKLYFQNLGISKKLKICRLTDIYKIKRKKKNEKFLFTIIRYKVLDKKMLTEDHEKTDLEKIQKSNLRLIVKYKSHYKYPKAPEQFNHSTNYLSLAMSGLANIIDQSDMFINEKQEISVLYTFFQNLFKEKLIKIPNNPHYNDFHFKKNENLREKHNTFIKNLIGSNLEKIPVNENPKEFFSLIFLKENVLYEFKGHNQEIIQIQEQTSEALAREVVFNYVLKNNDKKEKKILYENDISIFTDQEDQEILDLNNESEGYISFFLFSFLFIINFQMLFQANFYEFNQTISDYLELDSQSNSMIDTMATFDDVYNYFENNTNTSVTKKVYDSESTYNLENQRLSPASHGNTDNVSEISMKSNNYYPLTKNYYCGMIVNFKISLNKNPNLTSNNTNSYHLKDDSLTYSGYQINQFTNTNLIFDYYDNENPLSGSSYSYFYKPTINQNQKSSRSKFISYIINQNLYFFSYSIIFYNPQYKIAILYYRQFESSPLGQIKSTKRILRFPPYNLYQDKTIIIVTILYLLLFIYDAFLVIRTFSHQFLDMISTKTNTFQIYELIDFIVLIFSMISIVMFIMILIMTQNFQITLTNKSDFLKMVKYSINADMYFSFIGMTIFLIFIRIVRYLYTIFPNFGIVFQTLNKARHQLIAFIASMIIVISGFIIASHVLLGSDTLNYNTIYKSIFSTYTLLLGANKYKDMIGNLGSTSSILPYYYIFFMLFFHVVMLNLFLSVILVNYNDVIENHQKFNEAFALLYQEQSDNLKIRIINFLFCRNPKENLTNHEFNNNKIKELDKENNEENKPRIEEKKYDFFTKLSINYQNLKIKEIISGTTFKREELEENIKLKMLWLDKNNLIESIIDLEVDNELEFQQLSDAILYFIYILVFLTMVMLQLKSVISSEMNNYLIKVTNLMQKYPSQYPHWTDASDSLKIQVRNLYNNETNVYIQTYNQDYNFLNPPYLRLTFRINKYVLNNNINESIIFPVSIDNPNKVFLDYCDSKFGKTDKIQIYNTSNISVGYLSYKDSGGYSNCGGFLYYLNETNPFIEQFNLNKNYNLNDLLNSLRNYSFSYIVSESVGFNTYYNFLYYFTEIFSQSTYGKIGFENKVYPIPINQYSSILDLGRIIFELVYYFFTFYFIRETILKINENLKKYLKDDFDNDPNNKKFHDTKSINKYFRFEFRKFENTLFLKALWQIIKLILERIFTFVYFLISAIFDYIKQNIFHLIDLFFISITIYLIIIWAKIISLTKNLDFHFVNNTIHNTINSSIETDKNLYYSTNIVTVNELNLFYDYYIYLIGINSFVISSKIINYFKFSKSINNFILMIEKAKYVILFHIILIMVFNLGFSLWGYTLLGSLTIEYSSIPRSFLQLLFSMVGVIDISDFLIDISVWGILFIFSFTIILCFILKNILISIVIVSYKESKKRQAQNYFDIKSINLLENIKSITRSKYIIFINTVDNYIKYIRKFKMPIFEHSCYKFYTDAIDKLNCDKEKGLKDYLDDYLYIMNSFYESIEKNVHILEQFTLNKNPNFKLDENINSFFENCQNEITKFSEVSIFVKILAYIFLKIKMDHYYTLEIQDINLKKEKKHEHTIHKKKSNLIKKVKKISNKLNQNPTLKDNNFLKEFKKYYFSAFANSKSSDLLKKDLFEKGNRLASNKRHSKGIQNLDSHIESYNFESHNMRRALNVKFILNCMNHRNSLIIKNECENCMIIREYFDSIYILIYDLLVKYFYFPKNIKKSEKEILIGLYINKFQKIGLNKIQNFKISEIYNQKLEDFRNDIKKLINIENFEILDLENFSKDASELIMINNKEKGKFNILLTDQEFKNNNDNSSNSHIMLLYKSFCIWNALYIISFQRFSGLVRELKLKSYTFKYLEKVRNDGLINNQTTPFQKLMIKVHNLDKKEIYSETKNELEIHEIAQLTFNNYCLKKNKKNDDIDLAERNFFEQDNKFLMEEDTNNVISESIPKEILSKKNTEYRLEMLMDIWRNWKKKNKFYIFFGYNSNIAKSEDISPDNFLKNDFLNMPTIELHIYQFFTNLHRAEIFTKTLFEKKFIDFLVTQLREFKLKKKIKEDFNEITKIQDIIKYFHNDRMNYMLVYEFFMECFNQLFSNLKDIVNELNSNFSISFTKIKDIISKSSKADDFIKLFKLFISKAKFEKISSKFLIKLVYYEKKNETEKKKTSESKIALEENEENKIPKFDTFSSNEIFILFFSLDIIELTDLIRCIEDEFLKEFYIFLLIYLNEGNDFSVIYDFLDRKIQFNLANKYKKYCDLIKKREDDSKLQNSYLMLKKQFSATVNYIKYLGERINILEQAKLKNIVQIKQEIVKEKMKSKKDK